MICRDCARAYGNGGGHCTACHQSFKSDTAFDKHRVTRDNARRCLDAHEMLAEGMARSPQTRWWTTGGTWNGGRDE